MRFVSALVVSFLMAGNAFGVTVSLPTGARWFVTAPNAGRFARDAAAFLSSAAEYAPSVSARNLGRQIAGSVGLALVDATALDASGMDLSQPWMLFDKGGAQYLAVSVKDRAKLSATLDQWATARGLMHRDTPRIDRPAAAIAATFSRAKGSRAAAGYLISGDRAIIMVRPAERAAALVAAFQAVDGAAPIESGVDGTLLVWLGNQTALRDGWIALIARSDGLDLVGEARRIDSGFVGKDASRTDWIRAVTGSNGADEDVPAWVRVVAGPKTGAQLVDALYPILKQSLTGVGAKAWLDRLRGLATGPTEIVASAVDVQAVQRAEGGGIQDDMLRLTHPSVLFADRSDEDATACLEAAGPALCALQPAGDHVLRAGCTNPGLVVGRAGRGFFFGWPGSVARPAAPATPGGSRLSCVKGSAIASARFNLSVVASALDQVGFIGAMGNESLAGLLAIGTEYGSLMRASQPAVGLACLEPSGHVTLQGRWRFSPRH